MSKRMNVLFLPPPSHRREPWSQAIVNAIADKHNLKVCDYEAPLQPQFENVDVVIDSGGSMGTREMADLSSSVKLWQILGTGYDQFDLPYWRQRGIPVANCPGQFSAVGLAECAMMLILMLARRWNESQTHLNRGIFYTTICSELENQRLGLIGFGNSARALAPRAAAFGMRVCAVDIRRISSEERTQFGLEFAGTPDDIDQIVSESDFVSIHLPLDDNTRQIIDARRLGLMKPSAHLINVARGGLIDEDALYTALLEGRIAGAGLDVFSSEPLNSDSRLLKLPNVIATPHIAGTSNGTSRRRAHCAAENVERVAAGLEPLYRVDRRESAIYASHENGLAEASQSGLLIGHSPAG
jgi:D-3-phosphoglycerate dehydrogenase